MDAAADFAVLDGIAVDVQEDLPQMQRTSVHIGEGADRLRVMVYGEPGFRGLCLHNGDHFFVQLRNRECLMSQNDVVGLQLAHIQNVVHQTEQMVGRDFDLFPVAVQQFGVVFVLFVDFKNADDPV